MTFILDAVDFKKGQGLVPVVVQDAEDGVVLMLAYSNREALKLTLATGKAWYWSRSRNALWLKGEESGHVQLVQEIRLDCDGDTLLYVVRQTGDGACHEGYRSCFFRRLTAEGEQVIEERIFDPAHVYKK